MSFSNITEIPSRASIFILTGTLSLFIMVLLVSNVIDIPSVEGAYVFSKKWGILGSGNGQFNYPIDVAIDPQGYVYVLELNNNRIQKFQLTNLCPTGTTQVVAGVCFVTKWGTFGLGNGQFKFPNGIAVDSSGVYVSDHGNNRIQVFFWKTDVGGTGGGGVEPGIAVK